MSDQAVSSSAVLLAFGTGLAVGVVFSLVKLPSRAAIPRPYRTSGNIYRSTALAVSCIPVLAALSDVNVSLSANAYRLKRKMPGKVTTKPGAVP
jgi:hypothetical protein